MTSEHKTLCDFLLALINDQTTMAIFNLIFISSMIVLGGAMGSYARFCRDVYKGKKREEINGYRFGVASAFICVPFISSFLHVDYSSMILPIKEPTATKFIEQIFLLISVSGISAYLGYALLDGLADKVLKQQVENIDQKQKDLAAEQDELKEELDQSTQTIEKLEKDKNITNFELGYFKAIAAVDKAESLISQGNEELSVNKKLNEGLEAINDALSLVKPEDVKKDDYERILVLKAYILKRLGNVREALEVTDKVMNGKEDNPILIYNKACYKFILRQCIEDNSDIKSLVRKALTIEVTDQEFKRRQEKIRAKVIAKKDNDLAGLFTDDEIEDLKKEFKAQTQEI